jgi:hypothetical protein
MRPNPSTQRGDFCSLETMCYSPPTAEAQLTFLQQIQRLLSEGSFVATYKFALLHALADLAVLLGDDTGRPLTLTTEQLAERFLVLYERQSRPFPGEQVRILRQNTGRQAKVISRISEKMTSYAGRQIDSIQETTLLGEIEKTIRKMPLFRLQTVGQESLNFLYDNPTDYLIRDITLKPGIAYCLRAFYSFITSLIQGAWLTYVRRYNADIVGEKVDLQEFMFGARRVSLAPLYEILYELQDGRCFYTDRRLGDDVEVDHFIPWSRYRMDLGHNFVLAHGPVNRKKSDHIAAEEHLEKWTRFCLANHDVLVDKLKSIGIPHDLASSFQIARWCYNSAQKAQAQVWFKGTSLRKLSDAWQGILDQALVKATGLISSYPETTQ